MAEVRSGSFRTYGYSDSGYTDHYVFSWEIVTQSIIDNTTTIKWSVVGAGGKSSAYWTYVQEKYVTVNGVTQTNTTKVATSNGTVAFSGQTVIKHSNNGKGSFSASCGGAFYYYGSYNSTGSGSWDLPTIPRATTPTVTATSVTMGSAVTINLSPADSSFKHKLTYAFGSLSGQTSGIASGTNFTASGTVGVAFTPPTSLGTQIPNANSGTCTITCYTYNSGGTHIGTTTTTLTLNVPSYTPSISNIALSGVNLLSSTYVQARSSVTVTITASTSYGATIQSYSTVLDGKTYTAQKFTSSVLSNGTKTAKVTVKDSRGKSVTVDSSSITVYAYSIPYITSFSLARQSDGTTVIASLKGGFAAVNNKNSKSIKVTLNGVTNTVTSNTYTFDTTTTFTNVPTDTTFTGKLTLSDSYCYGDTAITKEAVLPTVAVTMDFYKDGNGIAMGKVAEAGNLLDVAWPIKASGFKSQRGTRPKSADIEPEEKYFGSMEYYLASSAMTTGKPVLVDGYESSPDGYILHFHWDNNLGYDAQMYIRNKNGSLLTRGCDNGTWGEWKQFIDNSMCKDYVVEQGTSGIWTYRKWNSGIAECWGVYTMTSAATKTWGSLYYSDTLAPRINYPFTFASRPQESAFLHGSSVAGWVYPEAGGIGLNTTTQTGQYGFVRPTTIASSEVKYEYTVVGKWK